MILFKNLQKKVETKLDEVYGTLALVFATIYHCVNEFKYSCTSTKVKHCLRRSLKVTTSEMIGKVLDMVMTDQQFKVLKIIEEEYIGFKNFFPRLLPKANVSSTFRLILALLCAILTSFNVLR